MLVSLTEILEIAEAKKIAVGAFNTPGLTFVRAAISAAEELNLPVIIQHAQCHEEFIALEDIGPIMLHYAEKAKVPVCVHLDHGEDLAYLEKALDMGFTGIMYDGSPLPYAENMANTKIASRLAAEYGVGLEAEIGSMGRRSDGTNEGTGDSDETKIYTDPAQAKEFQDETGIDCLACSFGTTHGIYLSEPRLDFSVIEKVRAATNGMPVVMHGGSGVSKEDFQKTIRAGVRKINYFTYSDKDGGAASLAYIQNKDEKRPLFFTDVEIAAREQIKRNVMGAMKTFAFMD